MVEVYVVSAFSKGRHGGNKAGVSLGLSQSNACGYGCNSEKFGIF